jgi:uncharacterized protein GlcG (DUF336 family)
MQSTRARAALFRLMAILMAGTAALEAHGQALTAEEVQRIISQSAAQAQALGVAGTIAVVDRVGNRLGVFQMEGARDTVLVTSGKGIPAGNGLENQPVPAELAAISKAITPALFSTSGNAFTTRTAGQLIQDHFNPGEFNQPAGPLYGVQFSQLSCSDLIATGGGAQGPKSAPLGLAADPGGLPLYKNGQIVGGVGAIVDGIYGIDLTVSDIDRDLDELVALAGTIGFEAPERIRADRIVADGKLLRFTDVTVSDLAGGAGEAEPEGAATPPAGRFLRPVTAGVPFGTPASGVVPDGGAIYPETPAEVLAGRFNPRAGTEGAGALTAAEVRQILASGLVVASRTRAQLRIPSSSGARFTLAIADTNGVILGIARSPDAPLSSTDIAVQKARTAAFFSRSDAAVLLGSAGFGGYVDRARRFGLPTAFGDGIAFTGRALQNLARPFFPDGIDGNPPGPFSAPAAVASPFNIGLQLDVVAGRLLSSGGGCSSLPQFANGIQLRVSSVPIYRGSQLVGAIGSSGDGAEQEDLVNFLAIAEAGAILGTINNADPAIRSDTLTPRGVRLRYVNCPQAPIIGTTETNVCNN